MQLLSPAGADNLCGTRIGGTCSTTRGRTRIVWFKRPFTTSMKKTPNAMNSNNPPLNNLNAQPSNSATSFTDLPTRM